MPYTYSRSAAAFGEGGSQGPTWRPERKATGFHSDSQKPGAPVKMQGHRFSYVGGTPSSRASKQIRRRTSRLRFAAAGGRSCGSRRSPGWNPRGTGRHGAEVFDAVLSGACGRKPRALEPGERAARLKVEKEERLIAVLEVGDPVARGEELLEGGGEQDRLRQGFNLLSPVWRTIRTRSERRPRSDAGVATPCRS